MSTTNTAEIKSNKLKFIGLYAASIIMVGIIMAAFWGPLPTVSEKNAALTKVKNLEDDQVLIADKLLHSKLNELYNSGEQYSIDKAEQSLQKTIDSLENAKINFKSSSSASAIASITASFKNVLINYKMLKKPKNDINTNEKVVEENQQIVLKLNSDLQKKDDRIKELESQLKSNSINASNTSPDIKKLNQEKEFLSSSLRDQVDKNLRLTQAINLQKQNIDKLNKQIDAFRKFTGSQQ